MNQENNSKQKWTLVTGGAGFIGSHLSQHLLSHGEYVVIIDNFNDYYDPAIKRANIDKISAEAAEGHLHVVTADICDRRAVMELFENFNISCVYHLAAMAGVRYSIQFPAKYMDVNVGGTINILDAINDFGKPRLIMASSSSVYGGSPDIPFSESDPVNTPVSPYAASKKAAELISHTYSHLHKLDITCLRFFTVYGPRQRPEMAIHLFTDKIINGEPIPVFGNGTTSRDYTYIDDIIDGILRAGERCSGYNIYNLGNNETVTLADLIATIESVTGKKAIIDRHPVPPGDVMRTWADLTKSQNELGYKPTTDIRSGIESFYNWYTKKREDALTSS